MHSLVYLKCVVCTNITVKQVDAGTILKGALDMDHTYDFTMCNPPFFRSETEADSSSKSRSNSRTLPRNGKTGSLSEVVVQGGELAFIRQMIQESVEMRNMVKYVSVYYLFALLHNRKAVPDHLLNFKNY